MAQQILKQQRVIRVSGTGKEKNQPFAEALNKIHNQILKEKNDVIIRIEPLEIQIVSAIEERYTERFLFFFLPRQRSLYKVELEVTVEVTSIAMEQVNFKVAQIADPNGIPLPRKKQKNV